MIWSEQELANMSVGGKDVAVERVMTQLDNPENKDIFSKKNFSSLWGVLGVAGVEGASESAREKIWQSLKDNGAVDAYDKGILTDFTKRITAKYDDNRCLTWLNMDNFEAGRYFNKFILKELFNTNEKLELETISYCYDEIKLINSLSKDGLSSRLKIYLESLRKQEAYDTSSGTILTKVFEKEVVLRKLTDVIVTSTRAFSEEEKSYLFYYLRDAVASGFDMARIGLDDQSLSHLMADFDTNEVPEVKAQSLLMRNADIMEFVAKAEENSGFFEECAAKFIKTDKLQIPAMIERCSTLIKVQDQPKGVVFALELVNLGQIKSAVMILEELAKKGSATEMTCFLHRLLPQAKGAEKMLLGILQINLRNQHTRNPWGDSSFFFEYISRRYLQAARSFAELGFYKECADLLREIVLGKWFESQDDLIKNFLQLTNWLLYEDKSLEKDLQSSIKKLNLQIFTEGDAIFVGTDTDNPITAARHRLEQKIKTATTFDVGGVLDKMSKAESSTYGMFKNIKQAFSSNKNKVENMDDELQPVTIGEFDDYIAQSDENNQSIVDVAQENEPKSEQIISTDVIEDVHPDVEAEAQKETFKTDSKFSLFKKKLRLSSLLSGNPHETDDNFNVAKQETSFDFQNNVSPQKDTGEKLLKEEEASDIVVKEALKEDVSQPVEAVDEEVTDNTSNEVAVDNVDDSTVADDIETTESITDAVNEDEKAEVLDDLSYIEEQPTFDEETISADEPGDALIEEPSYEDSNDSMATDIEPSVSTQEDTAVVQETSENVIENLDVAKPELSKPLVPEIKSWEDEDANKAEASVSVDKIASFKNKVNISKILKIKPEDVDKQFEKIKKLTSSAVKKAEEQVARVKQRVEDTDITNSPSVDKIKQIAKKIKFFKKK